MQQLTSYLSGSWQAGRGRERHIHHAISGEALWEVTSEGLDMAQARRFAIERGGKALQAMTFIERAAMLKAIARHLLEQKETFTHCRHKPGRPAPTAGWISKAVSAPCLPTQASADANCPMTPCGRKMN